MATPKLSLEGQNSLLKYYESLKSSQITYNEYWKELSKYFVPSDRNFFNKNGSNNVENYQSDYKRVYDSTGMHAVDLLVSALHSYLTNPSIQFFQFTTSNVEKDSDGKNRQYLQDIANIVQSIMSDSNFHPESANYYTSLAVYGTAVMLVVPDDDEFVRFQTLPMHSTYLDLNYKGEVDTLFYCYKMSASSILKGYEKNLSEKTIAKLKKDLLQKWDVVKGIVPRENYIIDKKDVYNKPYATYLLLPSEKEVIDESGVDYKPFAASRFYTLPDEVYGQSPAMKVQSDVAMLQQMKKETMIAVQLVNRPPVAVPDDSSIAPDLRPGGLTPYPTGTQDYPRPIVSGGQPHVGMDFISMLVNSINRGFYLDILQLGEGSVGTPKSATEINALEEQRLRIYSQILARQEREFLAPVVNAAIKILSKTQGMLPHKPSGLVDDTFAVRFSSRIARSQKLMEANNVDSFIASSLGLAQAMPEILDYLNAENYIKLQMDARNIPQRLIKSDDEVAFMRQQREQQQADASAMQQQLAESQVVKNIGGV